MNRSILIAFLAGIALLMGSCGSDDATDAVSEEWKAYQQNLVTEVAKPGSGYSSIESESQNGKVYYKTTTAIKATPEGTPYFTDSVVCRYTGWYLDLNGKKVEFDSTEGGNNAQAGRGFRIGGYEAVTSSGTVTYQNIGVIDGWATALQHMHVGDQWEICIPYQLGYGTGGNTSISGYTTLWFNVKLLEIIPGNPGEFD